MAQVTRPAAAFAGQDRAQAVQALYAEHALGLMRLALVMTGNRQSAEDIVQDAFLGLYRCWQRLRDPGCALAYVRSAVVNGCRSELRRRNRPPRPQHDLPACSAETAAMAQEEGRVVLRAVRTLPPRQREAVVLRHYAGFSEAETAQIMQISRGAAKSSASRGIAALRRLLGEGEESGC